MKAVIKKRTYDGIATIIKENDVHDAKSVINHKDYKKIYSFMNEYEKTYQEIIIECILDDVDLDDIYKTIELAEEDKKNDEFISLVEEIEESTNDVFMLSEQKVIEGPPVEIIIGDEEDSSEKEEKEKKSELNDKEPETIIVGEVINEKTSNKPNKTSENVKKPLHKLVEESDRNMIDVMIDYYKDINYGLNYEDRIREETIKEYEADGINIRGYNNLILPTYYIEMTNRIIAYETSRKFYLMKNRCG